MAASWAIPPVQPVAPTLKIDANALRVTWLTVQVARRDRAVFLSVLGISWLWFFGAVFLTQFPQFAQHTLGGAPSVATLLLAVFSWQTRPSRWTPFALLWRLNRWKRKRTMTFSAAFFRAEAAPRRLLSDAVWQPRYCEFCAGANQSIRARSFRRSRQDNFRACACVPVQW